MVPQDSIQQRTFEQFADFPEVVKDSFFWFLSRDEFQQRETCIEMSEQLMNVLKTVLQDGGQRWCAEQSAEFPSSPDVKWPVCTACRCGAGRRLSWRITCRRGMGRRLSMRVTCLSTKSCTLSRSSLSPQATVRRTHFPSAALLRRLRYSNELVWYLLWSSRRALPLAQ